VVHVEIGVCFDVAQVQRPCRPKIDISKDAAEPPLILVFKITRVGVLVHFHREQVFTVGQVWGDIEVSGRAAVLGEADFLVIYPDIVSAIHSIKAQKHSPV
jgi:hypothetical protein